MNLIEKTIKAIEDQDHVNDVDLSGTVEILYRANKAYEKALSKPSEKKQVELCKHITTRNPKEHQENKCRFCGKPYQKTI